MTRVPSEILDRLPPQNIGAEKWVLGSLLLDSRLIDDVGDMLKPRDFYADANQRIFRQLLEMRDERKRIDIALVMQRLTEDGEIKAVGGASYLAEVAQASPTACHAISYAEIVRDKARLRGIVFLATEALREAMEPGADYRAIVASTEKALSEITTGDFSEDLVTAFDAAAECIAYIDEVGQRRNAAGLMTGFRQFDSDIGGLFDGEFNVLAARLGVGKTAFACQVVDHNASLGRMTYFVSLEMQARELALRILCRRAGVDLHLIRTGRLEQREIADLSRAATAFSKGKLIIDQRPALKLSDIRRTARRLVKQDLRLIVVDYLQYVTPEDERQPREQQVAAIARGFKRLARELKIPVLVLAQLNREAETQTRGKKGVPGVKHLRESDVIGQAADVVMLLDVSEEVKKDQPGFYEATLRVGKNRLGPKGKIPLDWIPRLTEFRDLPETQGGF
jgi:replicative DNA helicase